jgi:MFS family permease
VLLVAPTTGGLLAAALLLGVGLGLSISAGTALASVIIPRPERNAGGGLGILNFVGNAGLALAPLMTAALVAATGGYEGVFAISGSLALVASGLVALVRSAR